MDLIKQALTNSTNTYRAGMGLKPMTDLDEARMDAQDVLQEQLRPFREDWVSNAWQDYSLLKDAVDEMVEAEQYQKLVATTDYVAIGVYSHEFILKYFQDLAEQQYKSMDDL